MKNKNIILLSIVLVILSVCAASPYKFDFKLPAFEKIAFSEPPCCSVIRIIGGDTIVVDVNNQEIRVRLAGIKPAEKYGQKLALFTKNLLRGEEVYIIDDPNQNGLDKYGYALKYVYRAPDGLFVNAEIIRQGYGRADTASSLKYTAEFEQLEKFARERSKGFWDPAQLESKNITKPASAALPIVSPNTSVEEDVIVYITTAGKKYHRSSCSFLRKSSIPIKLSEAKARGYTPCSRCNPP
ncbi:MAG: thermonuclease family protein [Phycisphaerae bacterium]|nr:thermonuclease family protein [Phycisphaerae bacterium]